MLSTDNSLFFICLQMFLFKYSNSVCDCGYGSYCGLNRQTNCLCEDISQGLYQMPGSTNEPCSELVNHCLDYPCMNGGTCYPSFGSFYCTCSENFRGHLCDFYSVDKKKVAQEVLVYYDIHEFELDEGISFFVIIKAKGEDFHIEVDDGNGHIYTTDFIEFKVMNPRDICKKNANKLVHADLKICEWVPNDGRYVAVFNLKYPYGDKNAELVLNNGNVFGKKQYVTVNVWNGNDRQQVEFRNTYLVFVPLNMENKDCILGIQLKDCSDNSNNPALYKRGNEFILKSTTQVINKRCKFVTDINYIWSVTGWLKSKDIFFQKSTGMAYKSFAGKTLLSGIYTVELRVDVYGSYSADHPKRNHSNAKKCWFEIVYEQPVPVIAFGTSRVIHESTKVMLDASRSYDPNNFDNSKLRFTWYCSDSKPYCNGVTKKEALLQLPQLTIGTHTMLLNISHVLFDIPTVFASQTIVVTNQPVIEGFELRCLRNCRNTRVYELTHLQVTGLPVGKTATWTFKKNGGAESSANVLREINTPEEIFIIKENALEPGATYKIKATIDNTFSEIEIITIKPPVKGNCKINPSSGSRGYTLFNIECTGFAPSIPGESLKYSIYQKIPNYEALLVSSTQISLAVDFQLLGNDIVVEVSNSFGASVKENLAVSLTNPPVNQAEIENLIYKLHDNFRNNEIEKGMTSVYIIADNINKAENQSMVANTLLEALNEKIPILQWSDGNQVAGGLRYLIEKIIDQDPSILLSKSVKTVTSILGNLIKSVPNIIKKDLYIDSEKLLGLSRSLLGTVNAFILARDNQLSNQTDIEAYQWSYFQYLTSSTKVLEAVNRICDILTKHMIPCQKPILIDLSNIVTTVMVEKMNRLTELTIDPSKSGDAYIKFDSMLSTLYEGKDLELQVTHFKKNLFWWYESPYPMNSEHINVELKVRREKYDSCRVRCLKYPMHTYMKVNFSSTDRVTGSVEQPGMSLSLKQKDLFVKVYKLDRKKGTGSKLVVEFHNLGDNELDVIILVNVYPDYDNIRSSGKTLTSSNNWYKSQSLTHLPPDAIVYLGILPGIKHPSGTNIPYEYEIRDNLCRVWSKENWNIDSCEVGTNSTASLVHCECKHFSLFGASVLVPPNELHPIKDIALFVTLKDNPYVFTVVILFLIIFFGLFIWAWKTDRKDKHEREVRLLIDNFPGDNYGYLLAVFTGEKTSSGTTAKVGVKIIGKNGEESHAHILNHDKDTLQLAQDNWFLIFTEQPLGEIAYLHVWHDNTGPSPDWNCNKIVLYDLTTKEKFIFLVDKWLSVSNVEDNWKLEWKIEPTKMEDSEWQSLARENFFISLRETHLWVSVFARHPRARYTRLQRLTVGMTSIMVSMMVALMFYGAAQSIAADDPSYSLTVREYVVAIESTLITLPITLLIAILFKKSRQPAGKKQDKTELNETKRKRSCREIISERVRDFLTLDPLLPVELTEEETPNAEQVTTKRKIFQVVSWVASFSVILISAFIAILYGLKLGPNKSLKWVTTFLLGFGQAIFITQPVRLMIYALVFTLLFRDSRRNLMLFSVEYKGINENLKYDKEYMSRLMELRSKPMYNPLSETDVMLLSKKRKNTEEQKWSFANFIFVALIYISLCILIAGSNSHAANYHTEHLLELFRSPVRSNFSIQEVHDNSSFREYVLKTLLPSLHITEWYNGKKLPVETEETNLPPISLRGWTNDYSSKLVGVPRFRQLRIIKDTCTVPNIFKDHYKECYSPFFISIEDTKIYNEGWLPAFNEIKGESIWKFSSSFTSESFGMYGQSGHFYPGGGYIANLTTNFNDSSREVVKLLIYNWLDELTRTLFIEFNIYNVFTNLFSQVTIIIEYLASGVIATRIYINTAYHQFYVETLDVPFLIALVFFVVVLNLSMMRMIIHISIQGMKSYFNSIKNIIDVLIIFFGFSSMAAYLLLVGLFKIYTDAYEKTDNESFISFGYPFHQDDLVSVLLSILVVLTTIRFLQLAKYGQNFYILKETIKDSWPLIISTLVIVFFLTTLLSIVSYISESQQNNQMLDPLPAPRIYFSNYKYQHRTESNEIYFKLGLNLINYIAGMFIVAIFTFFYAKSKFYVTNIGGLEGYSNHFYRVFKSFCGGLKSLVKNNIEQGIQKGTATRKEKLKFQRKLLASAEKRITHNFKLKKWEANDIMRDFVHMSRRHKKMCQQLDQIFELIE